MILLSLMISSFLMFTHIIDLIIELEAISVCRAAGKRWNKNLFYFHVFRIACLVTIAHTLWGMYN